MRREDINPIKMAEDFSKIGLSPTRDEWDKKPYYLLAQCYKGCYAPRIMEKGDVWGYGAYGVYICTGCKYQYPPLTLPEEVINLEQENLEMAQALKELDGEEDSE